MSSTSGLWSCSLAECAEPFLGRAQSAPMLRSETVTLPTAIVGGGVRNCPRPAEKPALASRPYGNVS